MLQTNVGKVQLSSPLILASGHITETPDFFLKTKGCAGMVTRSLKEFPPPGRAKTPSPRYVVFDDGHSMLNCEWGNSVPWTEWYDHGVEEVKNAGGAIIVSLSGREIESCCRLVRKFDKIGVDAYELNVSCAHSGAIHGNLNINFEHMEKLLSRVKKETETPIWLKLSYSSFLVEMAERAEEFGADAIVCTNSIGPGMFIDINSATPKLGIKGGAGGVTGRAIFPIALNCVYQLAQAVKIPIVGSGGITSAEDVIQMMMAGASAVELYTEPAMNGPEVFKNIANDLEKFLNFWKKFYPSCKSLVGVALDKRKDHCFVKEVPEIIGDLCRGCEKCVRACNFGAISMISEGSPAFTVRRYAAIDNDKCVGCNACVAVCKSLACGRRMK